MKFIALTKILFLCLLALTDQSLLHRVKKGPAPPSTPQTTRSAKFSIENLSVILHKLDQFLKLKFGQFTMGIFSQFLKDYFDTKAEPKCEEQLAWEIARCLVGGAEVTLEQHILNNESNQSSLTEELNLNKITEINNNSKSLAKQECPSEDWATYFGRKKSEIWSYVKRKINDISARISSYVESINTFLNQPYVLGSMKIGQCLKDIPALRKLGKTIAFDAVALYSGQLWIIPLKNIIVNSSEVVCFLEEGFDNLKTIIQKRYDDPLVKWYEYGKAYGEVLYRIYQITTVSRRKRRRLLK